MPSEAQIQAALLFKVNNPDVSWRQVSKDFSVSKSTLLNRHNHGHQPHAIAHKDAQRLNDIQEEWLVNWIIDLDRKGLAPPYAQVINMAVILKEASGDMEPLGHNWVYSFLDRNPTVKPLCGRRIDASRVNATKKEELGKYFDYLNAIIKEKGIKVENIFNMDEHGTSLGAANNTKVIGESQRSIGGSTHRKIPENREWVTVIETISAGNKHQVPPVVIFKGKTPQTTWFPLDIANLDIQDWRFAASQNGWTSNDIGVEWLTKVFIPSTTPPNPKEWRLLIVDGHGSHATDLFMYHAHQNKVYIIYLPAHTSHMTQPLDLCIFEPLKTRYHQQVDGLRSLDDESIVKKRNFTQIYAQARQQAIVESNRRAGFKAAGIVPFNPSKVLDNMQLKEIGSGISNTVLSTHNNQESSKRKASDFVGLSTRDARNALRDITHELSYKNTQIADLNQQLNVYKQTVGDLQHRKRRQIKPQPNERFVQQREIAERVRVAEEAQALEEANNQPSGIKIRLRFGSNTDIQ